MDLQHLERIRLFELERAVAQFPIGRRVLEIGAGSGWQARELVRRGFDVRAVDLAGSRYRDARVFSVVDYDGAHLPYEAGCFDVVFSSNVLEHIAGIEGFQAEIRRVLARDGRCVHVLPTAGWRVWTSLAFAPHLVKRGLARMRAPSSPKRGAGPAGTGISARSGLGPFVPHRHGERGSFLGEHLLFRRGAWRALFVRTGWRILSDAPAGLFYTGSSVLGARLSIAVRQRLSRVLGSSCRVWVLARAEEAL